MGDEPMGQGTAPAKELKLALTDRTINAIVEGIKPHLEGMVDARMKPLENQVGELNVLLRGVPGVENSGILNINTAAIKDHETRLRVQERIGYGMLALAATDAITRNWALLTKGAGKVLAAVIFWRH